MPAIARSSDAASRRSPVAYSRERSTSARLLLEGRNNTRTDSPRATNCRTTWLPRKPAAPVTSVVAGAVLIALQPLRREPLRYVKYLFQTYLVFAVPRTRTLQIWHWAPEHLALAAPSAKISPTRNFQSICEQLAI